MNPRPSGLKSLAGQSSAERPCISTDSKASDSWEHSREAESHLRRQSPRFGELRRQDKKPVAIAAVPESASWIYLTILVHNASARGRGIIVQFVIHAIFPPKSSESNGSGHVCCV